MTGDRGLASSPHRPARHPRQLADQHTRPAQGLGPAEQAEFAHGQRRTGDSLVATLGTRAGMLVMPLAERSEVLGRVRAFLASRPETGTGEFGLPMLTGVLRLARVPTRSTPTS